MSFISMESAMDLSLNAGIFALNSRVFRISNPRAAVIYAVSSCILGKFSTAYATDFGKVIDGAVEVLYRIPNRDWDRFIWLTRIDAPELKDVRDEIVNRSMKTVEEDPYIPDITEKYCRALGFSTGVLAGKAVTNHIERAFIATQGFIYRQSPSGFMYGTMKGINVAINLRRAFLLEGLSFIEKALYSHTLGSEKSKDISEIEVAEFS